MNLSWLLWATMLTPAAPEGEAPPAPAPILCAPQAGLLGTLRHWCCRFRIHRCPDAGPFGDAQLHAADHTDQRAGWPQETACYARPSENARSVGGYVGGGCPWWHWGEGRRAEEGTWGWDYQLWGHVCDPFLCWWHGRKYQGGTGSYSPEGPYPPEPPPFYKSPECKPRE